MILHILNGDSTKHVFEQATIKGEIVVWREVFSEGRVKDPINSEALWAFREKELHRLYKVESEEYKQKTIKEIRKINSAYSEINLWFEYDFYCQINMISLISYLHHHIEDLEAKSIHLICVGDEFIKDRRACLTDYSATEYMRLYEAKNLLYPKDFIYCIALYEAFISDNPNNFYQILKETESFQFFKLLKLAYQDLFKENTNSFSLFDQILINSFSMKHENLNNLIRDILLKTERYGFGDLQIMTKIKSLENNILSIEPPRLKEELTSWLSSDFIGNVDRRKWFFDTKLQKFFPYKT